MLKEGSGSRRKILQTLDMKRSCSATAILKLPTERSALITQMNYNLVDNHDRISELPDFVIHHILSFLFPYPDLVRTSVLSKKWFNLWATFPVFNFDAFKIRRFLFEIGRKKTGSYVNTREGKQRLLKLADENLTKYAAYIMTRFSEHNMRAQKFKLTTWKGESMRSSLVDKWIGLVVERDVQVLDLNLFYRTERYLLPKTVLSARSLTSLKLDKCDLPSSLMVDGVKFKSLKLLSLARVPVDEHVIRYLTTECPLLEEFNVIECGGHKNLSVSGLQNLERVEVNSSEAEMIEISAPNLTYFRFSQSNIPFPDINLASCKNLKTLHFHTSTLKTTWFCEFISNFPLLENVRLKSFTLEKKFKVSSTSLRIFELGDCFDMEEIKIDAPNLLFFRYHGNPQLPLFSMTSTSVKWEAYFSCDLLDDVNILWFLKLKRFLDDANKFRVLGLYFLLSTDSFNVDELKATVTTPYELDDLELKLLLHYPLSSVYPAILDAILWCCRPASLSCSLFCEVLDFEVRSNFYTYVYEKLLHQDDQCQKEIEIMVDGGSRAKKCFTDLNTFLDAIPCFEPDQKVLFKTKRQFA